MNRQSSKKRIHISIRKNLSGTSIRPRVSVFRSNKNIYVQVIDDVFSKTIASINPSKKNPTVLDSLELGKKLAEILKKQNITTVVFDRSGYRYHGKVKAIADGLREAGIIV